jgi:TatD DNase family protein
MTYTDSHAHLTSEAVYPQVEEILRRARSMGVEKIVNICTDEKSLERGLELAGRHPWIYNTAATTPHDVEKEGESFFPIVAARARAGELVAVGETGLDYHYEYAPRALQQEFLKRYCQLALECSLPLVIHCREAFADLFALTDPTLAAVLHCFTGTVEEARQVVERGWFVSFSGIVTFKKSEELRAAAAYVPLEQMLVETDTPYLAPQSRRGKPNEPAFLPEIVDLIAQIKKCDPREVARATSANAAKLFPFIKL